MDGTDNNNRQTFGAFPGTVSLALVARVALATTASAALALALVALFVPVQGGASYVEVIRASTLTRQHLGAAMTITGLVLLILIGLTTWFLALYGSFRVAGPLVRFRHNLELAPGRMPLSSIRSSDFLQEISEELISAVHAVRHHRETLRQIASDIDEQLNGGGEQASAAEINAALERLRELTERVRLDP